MKRETIIILFMGLLSAALSLVPNVALYLASGAVEQLTISLPPSLGSFFEAGVYFLPGFIFGVFVAAALSVLYREEGGFLLSPSRATRFFAFFIISGIAYPIISLVIVPAVSLVAFGFLVISFAVGGAVGGLALSLGLSIMGVTEGQGASRIILRGLMLGALSGVAFQVFAVGGRGLEPFDVETSLLSYVFLFLIWQPAMLLEIYRQAKKKKEAVPEGVLTTQGHLESI